MVSQSPRAVVGAAAGAAAEPAPGVAAGGAGEPAPGVAAGEAGEPAPVEPAPVDPAALRASLRPFGASRMLPPAAYVEPAVFAWEQRYFFDRGWSAVARSEQVAGAGDQRAVAVGHGGVLLMRGTDLRLRAFVNSCRHRGHELLPCGASANRRVLVCPYHAWAYLTDGRLRAAPGFSGRDGFVPEEFGLLQLPATEWHGLVFVNPSGDAGPLEPALADLEDLVAPYRPERLRVAGGHSYEVAANWKVLAENYHECYHCPSIHPELCAVSPPQSGENYRPRGAWVGGSMDLRDGMRTMSLDGASPLPPLPGLAGPALRTVAYVHVFPNVLLSLHPDYVMTHLLRPLAADRTLIECTWAFDPEQADRPGFDPAFAMDFWDITNRQDWGACESVQRGLSAPRAVAGPLSAEEDAVYQFVTMVARGYLGEPVRNPSVAGVA